MYSADPKKRTERSDTSILGPYLLIPVDEAFEPKLRKIAESF